MSDRREVRSGPEWDQRWQLAMDILGEFADAEAQGYQVITLETTHNHHENVVAQILPSGVTEYDPEQGLYSDTCRTREAQT